MSEETSGQTVSFAPTKMFLIKTLIKDIDLTEAILDLIDNAIDSHIENKVQIKKDIKLKISEDEFVIEDNCGGIHKENIYDEVFRFGVKGKQTDETIGVYGVGLKRSIFKMGADITIESDDTKDLFLLHIDDEWLNKEDEWELKSETAESHNDEPLLRITIKNIYPNISKEFASQAFISEVKSKIEKTYSILMDDKVDIYVNGTLVVPRDFKLLSGEKIDPYHKKFNFMDDVTTSIYAGYRPYDENVPFGWNVFCNNRLIIEGDRTARTGWGSKEGVNFKYPEDMGFLGIIFFNSTNPALLPWKTTKDDIQLESSLYRKAQKEMILVTKKYTDYLTYLANKKYDENNSLRKVFFTEEHLDLHSIETKKISEIADESDGTLPKYLEEHIFEPKEEPVDQVSEDEDFVSIEGSKTEKYRYITYPKKAELVKKVKKSLGNPYMSNKDAGIKTFDYYVDMEELEDGE